MTGPIEIAPSILSADHARLGEQVETRPPHWRHRAIINGTGAVVTAVSTVIFLATKFTAGAWVVVLAIPAFITLFIRIRRYCREIQERWARWNPGPPLEVLRTEYASVAGPILAFVDRLREQRAEQIVVLIPVATPHRLRYRFLHDYLDLVLTAELRGRPDVITARLPIPFNVHNRGTSGVQQPQRSGQP